MFCSFQPLCFSIDSPLCFSLVCSVVLFTSTYHWNNRRTLNIFAMFFYLEFFICFFFVLWFFNLLDFWIYIDWEQYRNCTEPKKLEENVELSCDKRHLFLLVKKCIPLLSFENVTWIRRISFGQTADFIWDDFVYSLNAVIAKIMFFHKSVPIVRIRQKCIEYTIEKRSKSNKSSEILPLVDRFLFYRH